MQCPPDNATYIAALQANVAAGFAVNNTVVAVPFPTDDSSASQATRINAALVTLQNLEGAGKGCPASSTTLLVSVLFPCPDHDFSAIVFEVSDTDFGWVGNVGAVEDCSVRCINDYRRLPSNVSPSDGPHIHGIPPYHHTRIPTQHTRASTLTSSFTQSGFGFFRVKLVDESRSLWNITFGVKLLHSAFSVLYPFKARLDRD